MKRRKYFILMSTVGLLISLDQLTKLIVVSKFNLHESLPIIDGFFNLTRVHNPGAAFGIFSTLDSSIREPFFLIVPMLVLLGILYVFHTLPENKMLSIFSLTLVVGGALGNLMDRIRLGYVVDFLDFHWKNTYHFPAFNVADSAICVGVFLLMLESFLELKQSRLMQDNSATD